jgi:hypothetical protein
MYKAPKYNSSKNALLGCSDENLQSRNLHMEYVVKPTNTGDKNTSMYIVIYMVEWGST